MLLLVLGLVVVALGGFGLTKLQSVKLFLAKFKKVDAVIAPKVPAPIVPVSPVTTVVPTAVPVVTLPFSK